MPEVYKRMISSRSGTEGVLVVPNAARA
jgi:hypothetical protein